MAESVIVYGKSGSGKSRSLLNFKEDEIFLINVVGKRLPFPKKFKYELKTDDVNLIMQKLSAMPTKIAVVDDAGYLMTGQFMDGHSKPKAGSSSFDLYNNIADNFWKLLKFIKNGLPDDVIVYLMMHEEGNDFGETKLRTIGKLLDQKVCIEGMCSVVLRCMVRDKKHMFVTQSEGGDISKSPEGMFELTVDNDLKTVDSRIREYWGVAKA